MSCGFEKGGEQLNTLELADEDSAVSSNVLITRSKTESNTVCRKACD